LACMEPACSDVKSIVPMPMLRSSWLCQWGALFRWTSEHSSKQQVTYLMCHNMAENPRQTSMPIFVQLFYGLVKHIAIRSSPSADRKAVPKTSLRSFDDQGTIRSARWVGPSGWHSESRCRSAFNDVHPIHTLSTPARRKTLVASSSA